MCCLSNGQEDGGIEASPFKDKNEQLRPWKYLKRERAGGADAYKTHESIWSLTKIRNFLTWTGFATG